MDVERHYSQMEGAVIGALLVDPRRWDEVARMLQPEDFSVGRWRRVYEAISAMVLEGDHVDPLTVHERTGEPVGVLADLAANGVPAGAPRYARTVRQGAQRRQAIAVLHDAAGRLLRGEGDPADVLADCAASMEAIQHDREAGYYDAAKLLAAAMDAQDEAVVARMDQGLPGVPTGLWAVNRYTGGWRKRKFYIVAARPRTGKTALAMHCAVHAALAEYPVGVIEIEMDAEELGSRAMANVTAEPYWHLTSGIAETVDRVRGADGTRKLSEAPLYVDDTLRTLSAILARAAEWKRKHDLRVLVIDHIGLITLGGKQAQSRTLELGEITGALKHAAKRLDIAIVGLCQLNRAVEHRKGRPTLADLRESGRIEEDADACMFLHCEPDELEKPQRVVEFGALKNRSGPSGWSPAPLLFDGHTQSWKDGQ